MAKEKETELCTISAKYLYEERKSRKIIPCTLSADIAFGGGVPLGCTLLLAGKYKSGKTTTALELAVNANRLYGCKIFYANIEGRLDNKVLSQFPKEILENMEVIMGAPIYDKTNKNEVIGYRKMSSQKWWAKIGELISNNPKSVIIVDSLAALSDEAELTEGMGHQGRGALQRLEAQFARQFGDLVVSSQICLILLTQIQANTSGWGDPIQMKCGNSIKHMSDAIVIIKSVEKWKPDASGNILGQDMEWKIECSPMGPPWISAKIPLRYGASLDKSLDIVRSAIDWGLIKANGAWYTLPFKKLDNKFVFTPIPDNIEDDKTFVKTQGEDNIRLWLIQNPEESNILEDKIRRQVLL